MPSETFGRELRKLRRRNERTVSLADLADVMDCSVTYMSAIERDERNPPSNPKIQSLLRFLGEEEEIPRMLDLAVRARKSIDIPIDGTSDKWASVLFGLARRSEEGRLKADDSLAEQIEELLNKERGEK